MPELPEVEAVRAGLARHLTGRRVERVEVLDPRPLRRQAGGAEAFVEELTGRTVTAAVRRGKRMWLPLDDGRALSAHLGMSGQLLVRGTAPARASDAPATGISEPATEDTDGPVPAVASGDAAAYLADPAVPAVDLTATRAPSLMRDLSQRPRHLRVRLHLSSLPSDPGDAVLLDLVDQRMLGGLHLTDLVPTADGAPGGEGSPEPLLPADATGLARDLLDPHLDRSAAVDRIRTSRRAVKTILMDQGVVSGVGNIYADEGLWAARLHGLRPGTEVGPRVAARLLAETASVMERALAVGGTSFDALYVDADGAPGYFARSLAVYGRGGEPCRRCGAPLRREVIAARSHTSCPRCQTRPRPRRR